jgi:hypothetical protein
VFPVRYKQQVQVTSYWRLCKNPPKSEIVLDRFHIVHKPSAGNVNKLGSQCHTRSSADGLWALASLGLCYSSSGQWEASGEVNLTKMCPAVLGGTNDQD